MREKYSNAPLGGNILKQIFERAAHKTFGVLIAIAAIPVIIAFIIVWLVVGIGGKAAAMITRGSYEKEEDCASNF